MRKRIPFQKSLSLEVDLINLTPLIDVVFVVLVTFILIAPFLQIDSIHLAPGEKTSEFSPEKESLSLLVKEDNSLWFKGKKVTLYSLKVLLEKEPNKEQIYLFHDKKASFGTYQEIKNLSEKLGFSTLNVVLQSS